MRGIVWLVLACLLTACEGDLTAAWEVKEPRILAARVEIEGDVDGRTRPRVDEAFAVRAFLAAPTPPRSYGVALSLCAAIQLSNGELLCVVELPIDDLTVDYARGDDLLLRSPAFVVPQATADVLSEAGSAITLAMIGAACVDGSAERVAGTDPRSDAFDTLFRCTDNEDSKFPDPTLFTFSFELDRGDGPSNRRPSFACDDAPDACNEGVAGTRGEGVAGSITIEHDADESADERAATWEPSEDAPDERCADDTRLPQVEPGESYLIRVRFDARDRETYDRPIEENDRVVTRRQKEDLVLSHAFTSHGDATLDSFSSLIDRADDDDALEAEITYTAPKQSSDAEDRIPEGGKLVRFFFVVRDQRGGVDYTTRALCVLPDTRSDD